MVDYIMMEAIIASDPSASFCRSDSSCARASRMTSRADSSRACASLDSASVDARCQTRIPI